MASSGMREWVGQDFEGTPYTWATDSVSSWLFYVVAEF